MKIVLVNSNRMLKITWRDPRVSCEIWFWYHKICFEPKYKNRNTVSLNESVPVPIQSLWELAGELRMGWNNSSKTIQRVWVHYCMDFHKKIGCRFVENRHVRLRETVLGRVDEDLSCRILARRKSHTRVCQNFKHEKFISATAFLYSLRKRNAEK